MGKGQDIPDDPPPSYDQVAGQSTGASIASQQASASTDQHASLHPYRNGISPAQRRSMEDEYRHLPKGWVRGYDGKTNHQFFVDTIADPPRSIWHHPYDDDEYLSTLSSEQRERVEEENSGRKHPSMPDIMAEDTDPEDDHHDPDSKHGHHPGKTAGSAGNFPDELPPRDGAGPSGAKGKQNLGRKLKDKLTGTTHEQRDAERRQRTQQEQEAYQRHLALRQAMQRASETGQPQHIGKDKAGKDVFIEPPTAKPYNYGPGGYGISPYGGGYGGYGHGYGSPGGAYGRPYGRGYGGGYGLPLAGGIGGGMLGGMLMGDMMMGGMGGGMGGGFGC